jgi:hypothetical protein
VSRGFKHDENWRPIYRFASVLALLMIPEFVAGGLTAAQESGAGIAQRVLNPNVRYLVPTHVCSASVQRHPCSRTCVNDRRPLSVKKPEHAHVLASPLANWRVEPTARYARGG